MNSFDIVAAQKDEFNCILDLLYIAATRLQEKGIDQWNYWLNPPEERLNWAREGFTNNQFFFLKKQSQIIGMYRLMTEDLLYWGKMDSTAFYIHSLVIIPEFTGQQLGEKIIKRIYAEALENKISYLRLDCNAANPALCTYYEKLGFYKVGTKLMPHSLNNLYELKVQD